MNPTSSNPTAAYLARAYDWSTSPLGPADQWPTNLRVVVDLLLGSKLPMFVAWGPELRVIYNDAFIELLDTKHPAAMGRPHLEIWSEARGGLEPFVQRVLAGESVLVKNVPFRILRHETVEHVWVTFTYAPLKDDGGTIAGFHCVCIENTEGVLEQQLQQRERRWLEELFQQAPGFLAVVRGKEHTFDLVNPAYRQLIGARDVIGKSVRHALPEVASQGFVEPLDEVLRTGVPYVGNSVRVLFQRRASADLTEAYVDFVYQPVRGADGKVEGVLMHGYDVTDKVKIQRELLAFSNSIPAIAWVASADGLLERFNSQWEAYTGVPAEEALGRNWTAQVHPDDLARVREIWAAARNDRREWQVEYRLKSSAGQWRWFRAHAAPELNANETVLRWFGTTTDVEDLRRAADVLRTADRQKDEFLATLAHELRNPLAPIRTAVDLVTMTNATEPARAKATDIIRRQVDHMAHLLDDLLDVSRITQRRLDLTIAAIDVRKAVTEAVEATQPLIARKRQEIVVSFDHDPLSAMADEVRLTQILTNVLNNAAKYTDVGGKIELRVARQPGDVVFTIIDDGVGLTEQAIPTIFDMFAQEHPTLDRSEGGLGIGLALVKGLVELHHGSITAHSEGLNAGSRFEIRIPAAASAVSNEPTAQIEIDHPAAGARARSVLLADDNLDALDAMAQLIECAGYVVHRASDGNQALAMASRLRPDVVVLDIGMPGLDGYEVARRVRAEAWSKGMMLVAATGWGQQTDRDTASAAGFDAHLTKPFRPADLFRIMEGGEASPLQGK